MTIKPKHIVIILLIFIIAFFGLIIYYNEEYTIKGTVIEHNVTADKMGNRTYSTIIKCEDGYIREKTGLNYYLSPVNSTVTIVEYKFNFNKK